MSNLLILGYYGFKDGYYAYGQYFKDHFDTVSFFPLIELRDLINHKRTNYNDLEKVISGESLDKIYSHNLSNHSILKNYVLVAHSCDMIKNLKLDNKPFLEYILELKNKYNFKLIQVDWDAVLSDNHFVTKDFDLCICADPYLLKYPNVTYFPQGYSPNLSFYQDDSNFSCDISFLGTNLYSGKEFPNKSLNRKIILDKIYNNNYNLKIYGPDFLKNHYPNAYQKYITYNDCFKIFSNSKICLNISPLENIENNGKFYYSERLPQIFACESIMLSNNNFFPLLIPDEDYIFIDNIDDLLPKIDSILNNKEKYDLMKKNIKTKKEIFNYEKIMNDISKLIIN